MAIDNHTSTSIFNDFTCPGRKQLKLKRHELPFVTLGRDASNWAVPATGGPLGGMVTGTAFALMTMKRRRAEFKQCPYPNGSITEILESQLDRLMEEAFKTAFEARSTGVYDDEAVQCVIGQCVFFWSEIAELADAAVQGELGAKLDQLSDEELLARANKGLSFDQRAYSSDMAANPCTPKF